MSEPRTATDRLHRHATRLDPWREQDACGVGFVARRSGERSREVLSLALTALGRVAHRGAAAADRSGDGAGVLTQIPHRLLYRAARGLGIPVRAGQRFGVGMFFLPADPAALAHASATIDRVLGAEGMPVLGWRDVPVDSAVLAPTARDSAPVIRQAFVSAPSPRSRRAEGAWERELYRARRLIERELESGFVCSLSCRTIVYKALLNGTELPAFYPDLRSPGYRTALALFHQRYSTNTRSTWALAQPFRMLAHNGEINTLWGNRNAMRAREAVLASPVWGDAIEHLKPVIWEGGSDSASLDNALELLVRSGRSTVHGLMMLIPEAHQGVPDMDPALRGFYEFHESLIEPWDGPAAVAFSDGVVAGSALDRNGLRPCRYQVTREGLVVAGSEAGLVDLDPADVVEAGALGPGEILVVDTRRHVILHDTEAKRAVAGRQPYSQWALRGVRPLRPSVSMAYASAPRTDLHALQLAFGMSHEDLRHVIEPMSETALDAVWSMGDDTPIAPLSPRPHGLYAYFRQRFAQVTNPPIDSLREGFVMSLRMYLGRRGALLADRRTSPLLVRSDHPVLLPDEMHALRSISGVETAKLTATWALGEGPGPLLAGLDRVCREAVRAIHGGARILIISDCFADAEHPPLPMLLAVGAVHQDLVRRGLRTQAGLVAEAGDAWDVHHFAALVGYGADAVYPWLALETVHALTGEGVREAQRRFRTAAEKGLLKVISKMGISTLSSYCGAQIFEALGVGQDVVDRCFSGTASLIGGIGFREIAEDVLARHALAYPAGETAAGLPDHGRVRYRKQGEDHGWSPPVVRALQREGYPAFLRAVEARAPASPRDLITIRSGSPISLDQVEPAEDIRRRFISTAMSLGALSPEAHRALAIGMNRMEARSNCGEGGEDPDSYRSGRADHEREDNRIKQIASGRFGVTTEYVVRADELEIKIAQGSKPGEGGQLPAHKVTELIARLRHSVPGVPLISPPPHHDIYSIEDLAQLIHDLKQVNPRARVGVKLVAEAGVGRVATGVAKAYADYVLISGHNGGTGASPLSSIKHAGIPWELGLAETQALLIDSGLRHRIEVRTDGGLRTGRDVVIAALLGAESFGFGTAALVAIGCAMARQCHLNTCPTGIATQDPGLRRKFDGTPEQVVEYFTALAEDVRGILAGMGARKLEDIIGGADRLERIDRPEAPRARLLDLSILLSAPPEGPRRRTVSRNQRPGLESLDAQILNDLGPALETGQRFGGAYSIGNHHLTVGGRIAGSIVERHGSAGLPAGKIHLRFRGTAGQSFGAFACPGMRLDLDGVANDYVGKGLSGGEIVIRAPRLRHQMVLGNVALYGATGGRLFAAGRAGHRFAVRNSGAVAVVEGAGNHCCEYMTGGTVLVLGTVGRNFGAGMTNGTAYLLDEAGDLTRRCNPDNVAVQTLDPGDERVLLDLLRQHAAWTASPWARSLLADWTRRYRPLFRTVKPLHQARVSPVAAPTEAVRRP